MQKQEVLVNKRELGNKYELQAVAHLRQQGYQILVHNFFCRFGEIDIIAKKEAYYVFVEVKYRKKSEYGYPREAVNKQKQNRIRRCASYYLSQKVGYEVACRFDVIEILEEELRHLEAAF